MISKIVIVLGILCFLYFVLCICWTGLSSTFSFVWLAIAILCFTFCYGLDYVHKHQVVVPAWIKTAAILILVLGTGVFAYVESLIISYSNDMPTEEVDYVIVLGAKIDGTRVTKSLKRRLDATIEYAEQYDNVKIIVSGGQGSDEQISEAQAMYEYLIDQGIEKERIMKEDASTNTDENIEFSREIIQNDDASVAIVTNSFHLYRAVQIAKKQGLANISGIAAPTDKILAVNYYVREGIAVIKYKLSGQI